MGAVQIAPDRALEVQASPMIFIEAMLLFGERASQCLSNEFSLRLEVRSECPFGQAGFAHDPGETGGGDAVPTEAFRSDLKDMLPGRSLMTFFETHLSFRYQLVGQYMLDPAGKVQKRTVAAQGGVQFNTDRQSRARQASRKVDAR